MSSETDQPRQRTVAELLAENGGAATGRRRRRRDDDPTPDGAADPTSEAPADGTLVGRPGGRAARRAAEEARRQPDGQVEGEHPQPDGGWAGPGRNGATGSAAYAPGSNGAAGNGAAAYGGQGWDRRAPRPPNGGGQGGGQGTVGQGGGGQTGAGQGGAGQGGAGQGGAGQGGAGQGGAGQGRAARWSPAPAAAMPGGGAPANPWAPSGDRSRSAARADWSRGTDPNDSGRAAPPERTAQQDRAPQQERGARQDWDRNGAQAWARGGSTPSPTQNPSQNPSQNPTQSPAQSPAQLNPWPGRGGPQPGPAGGARSNSRARSDSRGVGAAGPAGTAWPGTANRGEAPERETEQLGRLGAPEEPLTAPFRPAPVESDGGPPTQLGAPLLDDEDEDAGGPPTQLGAPLLTDDEDDQDDGTDYAAPAGLGRRTARDADHVDGVDELEDEGTPQGWAVVIGQWIAGALVGAGVWVGFRYLWFNLPVVALAAAVIITVGLVLGVRALLRNDDLRTTVFAVGVGLLLTVSPAILVLLER